jgi:hypothetical protein
MPKTLTDSASVIPTLYFSDFNVRRFAKMPKTPPHLDPAFGTVFKGAITILAIPRDRPVRRFARVASTDTVPDRGESRISATPSRAQSYSTGVSPSLTGR